MVTMSNNLYIDVIYNGSPIASFPNPASYPVKNAMMETHFVSMELSSMNKYG